VRTAILLTGIATLGCAPIFAQTAPQPPNPRIVGTIEQVSPQSFTVKADDGKTVTVNLGPQSRVVSNTKLTADGIKPGDHFATDLVKAADGTWRAIIGHTQPEPFGNNALWFHPIQERPGAMRLLAIVLSVTKVSDGALVREKFDQGEMEIFVPADVTLYRVSFDGPSILKPKMAVNAAFDNAPDGTIMGRFITVEKDGMKPVTD
jgi:hypothetical protein